MGKELFEDEDYNLFWLMRYAWMTWDKARTRELLKYNCTPAQAGILFIIQAIEPQNVTQAEISRWILREPHAISTIIDRMEKAGLVERVNDLKKKNMTRIRITKKGYEAYNNASKRDSVHEVTSVLSREEREQFTKCLEKIFNKAREYVDDRAIYFPFSQQ